MGKTAIPQNYKNTVNWVLGAYADAGVTFENGFQKDAIQNAVGARKNNSWDGWKCKISYLENERGNFIIIEDFGTTGLTGKNRSMTQINNIMEKGETLPASQKLSRFTSMFNSGGNSTGPGLYGAGKSVYSVASKCYRYIFDSLCENMRYVANENDCGKVYSRAYEGEAAKSFIKDTVGLSPKTTVGTRIIIVSPKEELIAAINDGTIIPFIQESWWRIIEQLPDGSGIYVNEEKIGVPNNIFESATNSFRIKKPEMFKEKHKVKNFAFCVYDNSENEWSGVSYYRKGMKIGEIELKDVPEELTGKIWGFIEVDDKWEEELSEIEDKVHFGVSRNKKAAKPYALLRTYCNEKVNKCLTDWGYLTGDEGEDKKTSKMLDEVRDEVFILLDKRGANDLNTGPRKTYLSASFKNIIYPTAGSETVTSGDKITFNVSFSSTYVKNKKVAYKLYIQDAQTKDMISTISRGVVPVPHGQSVTKQFEHTINTENSSQYAENKIVLETRVIGNKTWNKKSFSFFFDMDRPMSLLPDVFLNLSGCVFPTKGSRRINFGESLTDISYSIKNKRNKTLNYQLEVSVWETKGYAAIKQVAVFKGSVPPFEECSELKIDQILFDKDTYAPYMENSECGILELKANLTAEKENEDYEFGDSIATNAFKIYLNMEEDKAHGDAFEIKLKDEPEDCRRAWSVAGINRTVFINAAHKEYLDYKEFQDLQYNYIRRQTIEQMIMVYLEEGNYKLFSKNESDFFNLGQQEAIEFFVAQREDILFGG